MKPADLHTLIGVILAISVTIIVSAAATIILSVLI